MSRIGFGIDAVWLRPLGVVGRRVTDAVNSVALLGHRGVR